MLTVERLKEVLEYDPESGLLVWKTKTSRKVIVGKIAGSLDNHGYVVVRVDKRIYKAARLAWMLMTGEWPKHTIDHINLVRADNRWVNLREATYSQNNANQSVSARNTSGLKGVARSANGSRWIAHMNNRHLGTFDSKEDAHSAYCHAAGAKFGAFFHP